MDRALLVFNDLKDLGVRIALDDFGTGYSSLGYLRQFPVQVVKMDRSFIADLGSGETSEIILGAIVRLAREHDMRVVAEGVETAEQHHQVVELGCDCQGFYFAKPMSADQIGDLLDGCESGFNPLVPPVTVASERGSAGRPAP